MTKTMKFIHLAALTACASAASAQELLDAPALGQVRADPVGFPAREAGYGPRVVDVVYDNLSNVFGNSALATLGTCENAIENCMFAPGPWAGRTTRVITQITYCIAIHGDPTTTEQVLLIFWRPGDVNFIGWSGAGSGMVNPNAQPLAVVRIDVGPQNPNFEYHFTSSLTGLPGGGVSVPDGDEGVAVQVAWITHGCTPASYADLSTCILSGCAAISENRGIGFGSNSLERAASTTDPGTANPATVGSTTPDYGRDISNAAMCPNIGRFVGNGAAPVNSGNVEHRFIVLTPAGGPNTGIPTTMGMQVQLWGSSTCTTPSPVLPLGTVPDSGIDGAGSVGPRGVNWYSFVLAHPAADASLHFLDIDTEGSAGDISIGLFDADGFPAGGLNANTDDNSGSGANAQLTFGVGRRPAVGDGSQYDGRHGQLAAGTYYLAVAPSGSVYGMCFGVTPSLNAGGAYQLHLHTNVNGTPLAASVPPLINGQDYGTLDPSAGTLVPGIGQDTGLHGVIWSKFVLATLADTNHFLDLDYRPPLSSESADGVAYIFNSSGDLVYFDDDRDPSGVSPGAFLPQFSIGQPGARDYGSGSPPFDGNTPAGASAGLPAGTYYLANALHGAQDLGTTPGAGRRWHVRGTSSSNLALGADAYAGGSVQNRCCLADFNGDGDIVDSDIEAFFACLAGDCCPTCPPNADFNCDGDVGTDADIEAFFRVLAGGSC